MMFSIQGEGETSLYHVDHAMSKSILSRGLLFVSDIATKEAGLNPQQTRHFLSCLITVLIRPDLYP